MSRILTAVALLAQVFQMPKYVALEEIVDDDAEAYYRALLLSSEKWHQGEHKPFLHFQTQVIARGYREFDKVRHRSEMSVSVLFHERVGLELRNPVMEDFLLHYPNATFTTIREEIKDVQINGLRSDSPKEAWEPLNRADKLLRYLMIRVRNRQARNERKS